MTYLITCHCLSASFVEIIKSHCSDLIKNSFLVMKKTAALFLLLILSVSAYCQDYLSKYSDYERQAEYNILISQYWRGTAGGTAKGITGKFLVSYSGFSRIAILYFRFEDTQQEIEYRMSIIEETPMTRMTEALSDFQMKQFKVRNIDAPNETALLVLSKHKTGTYEIHLFQTQGRTPKFFPFTYDGWEQNEEDTNCIFCVM